MAVYERGEIAGIKGDVDLNISYEDPAAWTQHVAESWSNLYSIGGGCLDTRSGRGYSAATCASGSLRRGAQSTNIGVKKRPGVLRRTGLFFDEAVGFSLTYFKIVFISQ